MFILIFGKDDYRAWQKFKEVIEGFEKKSATRAALDFFDSRESNFEDFKKGLQHSPMFAKERIIFFQNAFQNPDFKTRFLEEVQGFADDKKLAAVFYEEQEVVLSSNLLSFFKKHGKVYQYNPLPPAALRDWVKKEIEDFGKEIEASALDFLLDSTGNDLWRISAEIKKLVAYKGKNKIITREDIELLVKPRAEAAIFKTIDAIASKNKKIALSMVYKHLEKGDSPLYLLAMINYQFRNLLLVKDFGKRPISEVVAALKPMHPFVVKKSLWLAEKFTLEQLQNIYFKLFQIDLAVKTGKIKPELALELLIADI